MEIMPLAYQSIATAHGQVGYCQLGHGEPLILIVGYSGTLYHWNKHFIYELAKHYTVYLIDNRKIGLSDSTNEYSMYGLAEDVVDFIAAKELHQPLLFGWSMGGIITQTILKQYLSLVSGAALLATVPHANYTNPEFVALVANSEHIPANEFRQQLYGMFFSEKPREELKDFITNSALAITDYHYRFNFAAKELQDYAIMAWHGMTDNHLRQIQVPVLLLRARDDRVVGVEPTQILANNLGQAKLIEYPAGGHFFLHRNPLQVARDVVNCFS